MADHIAIYIAGTWSYTTKEIPYYYGGKFLRDNIICWQIGEKEDLVGENFHVLLIAVLVL